MVNLGDGSKYFRESFRGFNREDVINFVTKMIKEYSENEEKNKAVIAETNAELTKKNGELDILRKESEGLNREIENLKRESDNSNREIESLKADIRKRSNSIKEIQNKYSELREEYKRCKAKLDSVSSSVSTEAEASTNKADAREIENHFNKQIAALNSRLSEEESEKEFLLDVIKKLELETGVLVNDICDGKTLEAKKISFENDMIDMAAAKKKISALEMELSVVKKENEELNELRIKPAPEEQKIYESITSDLGSVIYTAKKTAESIVDKAKEEAEDIMNKANMKRTLFFEEYERDVFKLKEQYRDIKEHYSKVMELFQNSYESYSLELTGMADSIEKVYSKF